MHNQLQSNVTQFLLRKRSAVKRYGGALVIVLASFVTLRLLDSVIPGQHVHSIDLASTILATLYGGLGPGLLVAFSEAILVSYYFVEPIQSVFESGSSLVRIVLDTSFAFLTAVLVRKVRDIAADEQEARKISEEQSRSRERILSVVSHDLRNPLSAVKMNATLIEKLSKDDDIRRRAESIRRSSGTMNRLIADLLDAARIERGTFSLDIQPNEVESLLNEVVETMLPQAKEKEIVLHVQHAQALPAVPFDYARIFQVLTNLVGNAIKFSPPRSRVGIDVRLEGESLVFRVSDQGPGIAPEHRDRIFERHWQNAETAHLGIGLGLFISKCIVENHGGRINVEGTAAPGSTFRVQIPLRARIMQSKADVA